MYQCDIYVNYAFMYSFYMYSQVSKQCHDVFSVDGSGPYEKIMLKDM